MAESDGETKMDEMECDTLQKAISDVERATANAAPGSKQFFEVFLLNAKGRVNALDKKIKDAQVQRETHTREAVVMAQMVQQETALSTLEKETFGGFLKKDFFTKSDFGALEQFYTKTWDRLSEAGKDAMSHRVWEGVRRNEFTFGELPKAAREKETERAYEILKARATDGGKASGIPSADREDFIRAYEGGQRGKASEVLERESFKNGMFRGRESAARSSQNLQVGQNEATAAAKELDGSAESIKSHRAPQTAKNAAKDLTSGLEGLQLAETEKQGSSADLPNAKTAGAAQQSTRRG